MQAEASPLDEHYTSWLSVRLCYQQIQDLFNAYVYKEQEILPWIQVHGIQRLTPERFMFWLHKIHSLASRTLAHDLSYMMEVVGTPLQNKNLRGVRKPQPTMTWEYREAVKTAVLATLEPNKLTTKSAFFKALKQSRVPKSEAQSVAGVLCKVEKEENVLSDTILKSLPPEGHPDRYTTAFLHKLTILYHQDGYFNPAQRQAIDKIVTIGCLPENIPTLMSAFAKDFVTQYQAIAQEYEDTDEWRSTHLDKVLDLTAFGFAELMRVNPYFNANLRTACCLVNITLNSFGYDSILLSTIAGRNDPNSDYNKAIKVMAHDRGPLIAHLKFCMENPRRASKHMSRESVTASLNLGAAILESEAVRGDGFDPHQYFKQFLLPLREEKDRGRLTEAMNIATLELNMMNAAFAAKANEIVRTDMAPQHKEEDTDPSLVASTSKPKKSRVP